MDIRRSRLDELLEKRKVSKKDVRVLKKIIDDLTVFFNSNNALVEKFKTGKKLFDEMDQTSDRELQLIFNENARPKGAHKRTYNKPAETEITDIRKYIILMYILMLYVCGVCFDDKSTKPAYRDIIVFFRDSEKKGRRIKRIRELNAFYDPLQYTFFHPMGQPGYHSMVLGGGNCGGRKFLTPKTYYSFLLQLRADDMDRDTSKIAIISLICDPYDKSSCARWSTIFTICV